MKRRILLSVAVLVGLLGVGAAPAGATGTTPSAGVVCVRLLGNPFCISRLL